MTGKANAHAGGRVPVFITLDPDDYEFILSCMESPEALSLDELFEAALATMREHLLAYLAWSEEKDMDELTSDHPPLECRVLYRERTQ